MEGVVAPSGAEWMEHRHSEKLIFGSPILVCVATYVSVITSICVSLVSGWKYRRRCHCYHHSKAIEGQLVLQHCVFQDIIRIWFSIWPALSGSWFVFSWWWRQCFNLGDKRVHVVQQWVILIPLSMSKWSTTDVECWLIEPWDPVKSSAGGHSSRHSRLMVCSNQWSWQDCSHHFRLWWHT